MPISGAAPLTINFTNTSTGAFTSYLWQFGDGGTSTSANPSHTYSVAGTYTVTLFATTVSGTVQQSDTVTVGVPVADYTPPAVMGAGLPGDDPQVMLRTSNDGGKTWSRELWRSAGKVGEWMKRVIWNRCGSSRRRVWEVSVTDPIAWKVTGCFIETPDNG
jgi:PKD repeat protein